MNEEMKNGHVVIPVEEYDKLKVYEKAYTEDGVVYKVSTVWKEYRGIFKQKDKALELFIEKSKEAEKEKFSSMSIFEFMKWRKENK